MPPCGDPFSSTQENTPIVSTPPFFSPFISIVQASFQWLAKIGTNRLARFFEEIPHKYDGHAHLTPTAEGPSILLDVKSVFAATMSTGYR